MTRLSTYFLPTLREDPADAESLSHRLMVRAGLVRQLGAGLWTWLPAGYRVIKRVEAIIREEIDAIGGQEMLMPVLQPAELWRQTGPLRDRRAVQAQGPQGLRPRARDDPRGGAHLPRRPRDPLLPRAAEDPLPRPGQGARRAAPARRRPAHARVHDEGLLLVRPRRGGARRELRAPPRRLRADPRPLRAALVRGRVRRRDDGRHRRARVHGAVRGGRERGRARARLRRQRRGRLGDRRSRSSCRRRSTSRARCRRRA